jgi:hypothetical protein
MRAGFNKIQFDLFLIARYLLFNKMPKGLLI